MIGVVADDIVVRRLAPDDAAQRNRADISVVEQWHRRRQRLRNFERARHRYPIERHPMRLEFGNRACRQFIGNIFVKPRLDNEYTPIVPVAGLIRSGSLHRRLGIAFHLNHVLTNLMCSKSLGNPVCQPAWRHIAGPQASMREL